MNDMNHTQEVDGRSVADAGRVARLERARSKGVTGKWRAFRGLPIWQQLTIGLPGALLLFVALLVIVDVAASLGRIHPGVRVEGVPVGGMRVEAAASRVAEELGLRLQDPVKVSFEGESWEATAGLLGVDIDSRSAADRAYEVGRTGGLGARIGERASAWTGGIERPAPVSADESLTATFLQTVSEVVDTEPQDAAVKVEGTEARLEPAVVGLAVRRDALERDMLAAFVSPRRQVEVRADFVPVGVTDEDAAAALADAQKILSGPVSVTYEDTSWEFSAAQISPWIAFRAVAADATSTVAGNSEGDSSATPATRTDVDAGRVSPATPSSGFAVERKVLETYIDPGVASATIEPKVGSAGRAAKNATFKVGGGSVTIVPSQDGVGPDIESLALEMTRVLKSDGERVVELRTLRVEPEITTEGAQKMGITERISTYTTKYSSGATQRVSNIHTLADAIDGTLIAPGEVFSFNETVGPRTAAKGYQEAPAIVNGKLVPQLGGGICQFGTTIFNTVFESGLPVVERKNHSFYISSYPKGRDATLSWGGPDFKFRNDTEYWMLIATAYSNSSVTVSLYGTDPGYDVMSEVGPWTDVRSHPVKEIEDPELEVGMRHIEDSGIDGRTIVVKRLVRKNGALVREDSFRSVYRPKEQVVRVGTKVIQSQEPTAPAQ